MMAYNNPEASGIDMPPALVARLAAEVDGVVAVKECSGDARRIPAMLAAAPGLEVLVGGDDWALEGFAPARPAGCRAWPTSRRPSASRCTTPAAPASSREARALYARLLPLAPARHDARSSSSTSRRAQDARRPRAAAPCARRGCRSTTPSTRDAARRRSRRCARPSPRESGALLRAVDSHTEGMPTRVITGGVGPIPGATMLERKLHFEAHMDDLRLLLMREPRGHSAMSGAILQPPTRPDADWGVLFIEVSGCLPMCGHGTIGVATVLVETAWCR